MAAQPPIHDDHADRQARTMLGCGECAEGEVLSTSGARSGTPQQQAEAVASAMQQVMNAYERGVSSRPPVTGLAKQYLLPG